MTTSATGEISGVGGRVGGFIGFETFFVLLFVIVVLLFSFFGDGRGETNFLGRPRRLVGPDGTGAGSFDFVTLLVRVRPATGD